MLCCPAQVWVFRNASLRCLCIAFRGTEQVKWKDLVTDLSFQPAAFNPERVLESGSSHSLLASSSEVHPPLWLALYYVAHQGFPAAVYSMFWLERVVVEPCSEHG